MQRIAALALGLTLFFSINTFAQDFMKKKDMRKWTRHLIPGAMCGDGSPYGVFISEGKQGRLAIQFEGGGACWNEDTCYGLFKYASMKERKKMEEEGGVFSNEPSISPVAHSTAIYFPYCTGDVFAANHSVMYGKKLTHHVGKKNVQLAFDYLIAAKPEYFTNLNDLMVYGYSAGALGALVHVRGIDALLSNARNKTLILDAPGLHWGQKFWQKFSNQLLVDFKESFEALDLRFQTNDGNISDAPINLCRLMPEWKIGVLQSSRDRIMSVMFGEISQDDHEVLVYSPVGIFQKSEPKNDNCAAWVPRSTHHSSVKTTRTDIPVLNGMSALRFLWSVWEGSDLSSYRN